MTVFRKVLNFATGLWTGLVLLVVLAGITAFEIYHASSSRRAAAEATEAPAAATQGEQPHGKAKPQEKTPHTVTQEFGEKIANFILPASPPPEKEAPKGPPPIPDELKMKFVNSPTAISLYPPKMTAQQAAAVPPTYYLPSFRVIRCELIAGPQTGNMEIPLIGIVLDSQCNIDSEGVSRLVIPAGVEVHGLGKASPIRDRIDGDGKWTLVWRTKGEDNGTELTVDALALNRDYDEEKKAYGDLEKSPGIVGRRFETSGDSQIEQALLASIAAVTRDLKSYAAVLNPLTSQVVNEQKPTVGNALLEGAGAGTDRLAQTLDGIRKEIDEKGYYVAVLPGKEFYLYTKEPVDLRKARRPQPLAANDRHAASAP
jgi:hypothetical protein